MKILSRGNVAVDQRPFTLTCNACKTVIETCLGEMSEQWDQRDGDYYEIKCPVCGRMITKAAP